MLVLRTSNFQGATIRPIAPRHKRSIVFIIHHFVLFKNHIKLFPALLYDSRESQK